MKLKKMEVLSDSDIQMIHSATVDILSNTGVKILGNEMLKFLKSKGITCDGNIVKFSKSVIEDTISQIPSQFDVFNREGEYAFTIGDGVPKVAAGHNAVFWLDSDTGETRPSKVEDVELFAKICDKLDNIDVIGIPVMPQDVDPAETSLLYGVKACVENSSKPLYFSTDRNDVNRYCIKLIETVFKGNLKEQVYGISQVSPTSPLFWEDTVCNAIMETVETGVPLAILPEPNAGVSCPYTLAGLLTINNAECLSGLIMIQLLKPKAKAMYANSWTTTDMRTGAALVGSVETTICRIAAAQLAKFYELPSHTTAPNSDNHAHDEQNAWEKTLSQFCAIAAGHDLIVNCGMFATGMTCSHEQLIMDEEISALSRRLCKGVEVDETTIAADLIKEIGPQGEGYLTAEHTMERLRSDEFHVPRVAVRGPFAAWKASGGLDSYMIAQNIMRDIKNQPANLPDDETIKKMNDLISAFVSEL
ncbi:MAG: trimethylamine methyltransferase family protein [Armatimonadota bacterium]